MALGAAIACPDRKVILVQADGSACTLSKPCGDGARESRHCRHRIKERRLRGARLEMARVREGELNAKTESMLDLTNPALDW